MKILVLSEMFPKRLTPVHGTFVLEMARGFALTSQVRVVCPRFVFPLRFKRDWLNIYRGQPTRDKVEGIQVEYPAVPALPLYFPIRCQYPAMKWTLVPYLRKLRSRFSFDVIFSVGLLPCGWVAIHAGESLGVPVINAAVGTDLNVYPGNPWLRPAVQEVLKRSHAVTTMGEGLRKNGLRAGGSPERLRNMPFGYDRHRFFFSEGEREPVILFLGQLIHRKGIQRLIAAFPEVRKRHPRARLEIVGDGPLMSRMKEKCARLKIADAVTFHGNRPHTELAPFFRKAWLYCLPSDAEGWPIASMDALGSGVPVVGTLLPGLVQQVREGETGHLVPVDDIPALSDALVRALSRKWDRKAIERSMSDYTLEAVGKRYCDLFEEAIRASR